MSQQTNWKGELQTFCAHYDCLAPRYTSKQLVSTEWESECTVQFPKRLLSDSIPIESEADTTHDDSKQLETVISRATRDKKKESQTAAAEAMMSKLNRLLSAHIYKIQFAKHLRKLRKDRSLLPNALRTLEAVIMTDEYVSSSQTMQQLIQSHAAQWIDIESIMSLPVFSETFGRSLWNEQQYQTLKNEFIEMVQNSDNDILEISDDRQYIRRKQPFKDIHAKNEEMAVQIKQTGNELFKQGQFADAIEKYLEALKYNVNDYKVVMNLSVSYLKFGDLDNALEYAQKAIVMESRRCKPYAREAMVLEAMNRKRQAVLSIARAIEFAPREQKQEYIRYRQKLEHAVEIERNRKNESDTVSLQQEEKDQK